jgi:DUF1680 family protein
MLNILVAAILSSGSAPHIPVPKRLALDYPVKPVPFTSVHFTDQFWAPRIEVNRTVSIPTAFQKCEETNRVRNFESAAKTLHGDTLAENLLPDNPYDDSDIYKIIEGASYSLSVHPDPKLDAYVDGLIAKVAAAQEPDGYLYTARTINPEHPHPWSGHERWVNEEEQSHELYDAGHLYESAVAHYLSTGKRTLLDVALKNADLLVETFGPGKRKIWPGHEVVEMGLCKLYRVTGEQKYLNLAKFLIDSRGGGGEYWQAQEPVVDQTEAVGHAVRAGYLYSGVADVAALTGEEAYLHAIDAIWENVVGKKLYVTGGIGARGGGEAFGANYELPNMSAYCETCAAVANDFWNYRLFLLHGDAKYVDVFERTLYNGLISGVSLKGNTYFYPNPLESRGQNVRSEWFGTPCCPGNITRFMPSVPGYVYAERGNDLYVNLFASSTGIVKLDSGRTVTLQQETKYPWDGDIRIKLANVKPGKFGLRVRIPGWARNEPVPSDLYRYADTSVLTPTLKVNGHPVSVNLDHGYAVLDRSWRSGDEVDLNLPMPVRRVVANDSVVSDRGRIALQRGPIVYCAEWPDNPGGKVRNLMLSPDASLSTEFEPSLLNGVAVVKGTADSLSKDGNGGIVRKEQPFTAIPYYAWANRGRGEMLVWIPDSAEHATPTPYPTLATTAIVSASRAPQSAPYAINDPHDPESSVDQTEFFHWWPHKGTSEWVMYTFPKEVTVSSSHVYWFDDTGIGECRVPQSWTLLYKEGDNWKPVETTDAFGTEKDKYNTIHFKPVKTTGLRLEIKLQDGWSTGIQQWRVE